jgi:5-oxoprolinase (ATP-hydrolysing)
MLNAPYRGGTHLPDITVVTPVFDRTHQIDYIVASRAHHADVGGITPGSMPGLSRHIDEEGVSFASTLIVRNGRFLEAEVRELLGRGAWPARNPEQNIADLKAQLAANARGADELARRISDYGAEIVSAYARHVRDNAEECMRRAIRDARGGRWQVELDGGEVIAVEVTIDRELGEAHIDFEGTGPMSETNFNAPLAVTRAVVLYVFRTLIAEDIPLNAGCLAPLRLSVRAGSLLDPHYPAAVVAGNVETSQCIADALFAALGVLAASQGTMNNLTFGNERYQYYETICGGCGAGSGFAGADAVHSHMTNSRLTDTEVLEQRFPVRIRQFCVRRGSGGAGRWRGGDGVVREIEFLEAMQAGILSNRRRSRSFGLDGAEAGKVGRNTVLRASGRTETLGNAAQIELARGDRIRIETPGGGGFGRR